MYCTNCGAKNTDEHVFCSNCGTELKKDVSAVVNTSEAAQQNQAVPPAAPAPYQQVVQNPYTGPQQVNNPYINNSQGQIQNLKFNGMSIAGFILSCCAFIMQEAGFICAILGLVFSIIGLTSKNTIKSRGKGFAIAGISISGVYFLMILCAIMFVGSMFSGLFWEGL